MIIGIPRERKTLEKRVALTPQGALELVKAGNKILIEQDAGIGSFFTNQQYQQAGAEIISQQKELWERSQLIVKVKEPHESELILMRSGLLLFTYLHLASLPEVTNALLDREVTSIAYELVCENGIYVLLKPMSEIAGKLAVQNGAHFLQSQNKGRGILLGGTEKVPPGIVTIIGAGNAGKASAKVAVGMGAKVFLLDINQEQLDRAHQEIPGINILLASEENILDCLKKTDLLIGAILVPGAKAPKVVTQEMILEMPKGSVVIDISIDQSGCIETIKPTSLDNPIYEISGILHYGVTNMPAQTARTSTLALTNETLPFIKTIAAADKFQALDPNILAAVSTHLGKLTNQAVALAHGLEYSPLNI